MAEAAGASGSGRFAPILAIVVLLTTLIRFALSWMSFGFWTGDDVEILQAGFARVFDLEFVPWEIRHLLLPDLLVAPPLHLASLLGITSTSAQVWMASWPFVLLAGLNIVLVFKIGLRWFEDEVAALVAASLYSLHWLALGYGSTVYPRTATTTCVLLGVYILSRDALGRWWPGLAGGLLAVAFAFRFSEVIYVLPCVVMLLVSKEPMRFRVGRFLVFGAGLGVVAAALIGVGDWLTWERPYSSLVHFFRFTFVERESSSLVANQPWYWYAYRLPKWLPLTYLPFLFARRQNGLLTRPLLFVVLPLLILSAIHHKELRYLQGIVPFFCLAGAGAAGQWWALGRRRVTAILLVLSALWGINGVTFLSKTSMAAVLAAHDLAAEPTVHRVALSQMWAYGSNLHLGDIVIRNLPVVPTVDDLKQAVPGCEAVALYVDVVKRDPALVRWLRTNGYTRTKTYEHRRSRSVTVFLADSENSR